MKRKFTRFINKDIKCLLLLVVLPLYVIGGNWIGNALLKFIIIHFRLSLDMQTMVAYLNLIIDSLYVLFIGYLYKDLLLKQWKDFISHRKEFIIYACVTGLVSIYIVNLIGGLISMFLSGESMSENQALINMISQSHPFIILVTSVFLAPIVEEIIFRGMIFGWLYEWNTWVAHVVSGFLFGFVHIMIPVLQGNASEWLHIVSYFAMGIVLSVLYEKKNNIFVPMMTHAANNLVVILPIFFL